MIPKVITVSSLVFVQWPVATLQQTHPLVSFFLSVTLPLFGYVSVSKKKKKITAKKEYLVGEKETMSRAKRSVYQSLLILKNFSEDIFPII